MPRLDGRRALVTGGRGFIGATVCRRLEEAGAEVFTLGRTPPRDAPGRRALVGDLQSVDQTREAFRAVRPHAVFHLASQVLGVRSLDVVLSTLHHNLTATVNLLTAAREAECDRVVLAGSMEEPDPSGDWSVPSSPYAAAKLAASTYGRMFHALFDLPVVLLRLFMVYGPGQQDLSKLVPHVITSLHRGDEPTFTSGTRLVDWVYVDDVADAFVKAAYAPGIEGATLDIGSGEMTPIRDVICKLFELMDAKHAPRFGQIEDRPMEQERRADVARPRQAMGWRPRTSLDEGLRKTVAWYTTGS